MDETRIKERGAASVEIELTKGVITVRHGEGGAVLAQWVANAGDWEKLWATIRQLQTLGEEV
jgi:hypothetical protein